MLKIFVMLLFVVSCGKDPVSNKETANSSKATIPNNNLVAIELVTIGCQHAPTCFRACKSLTSNDTDLSRCMMRQISIDKEYTDVEIIKYCHKEPNGNTVCPKTELDTEFTFLD